MLFPRHAVQQVQGDFERDDDDENHDDDDDANLVFMYWKNAKRIQRRNASKNLLVELKATPDLLFHGWSYKDILKKYGFLVTALFLRERKK